MRGNRQLLGQRGLLALVSDDIGRDSHSVVLYADIPNETTLLWTFQPREYDAVVLVWQVANFATGLGSIIGNLEATNWTRGNGAGLDSIVTAVMTGA